MLLSWTQFESLVRTSQAANVRSLFSGSITSEIIFFGTFIASFVEYSLSGHCYSTIHQLPREKVSFGSGQR